MPLQLSGLKGFLSPTRSPVTVKATSSAAERGIKDAGQNHRSLKSGGKGGDTAPCHRQRVQRVHNIEVVKLGRKGWEIPRENGQRPRQTIHPEN